MSRFVGIDNDNEFFSEHYLEAVLAGDLKDVLASWRERGDDAPPRRLQALSADVFRHRERLRRLREPAERVQAHRDHTAALAAALGWAVRPTARRLPTGLLPILAEAVRQDGTPLAWWIPVVPPHGDEASTLSSGLDPALLEGFAPADEVGPDALEERRPVPGPLEAVANAAFDLDEPPRFLLLAGPCDVVLLERAKWSEQRVLRFDLAQILDRRDGPTIDVTAALLARDALAPDAGRAVVDDLDERSHRHAYEVSDDLKYALREAIELLGNAAVVQLKQRHERVFNNDLAEKLSRECLRFMYRLLFLFYLEARPELGYAPAAEAYERGYGLERLRELEQAVFESDEARDGTYIDQCLRLLFRLVFEGTGQRNLQLLAAAPEGESTYDTFTLRPLRSHLFDPARLELLGPLRFPNHVLRRVIELMSLTRAREGGGRGRRRGRVSYATLGINQLGAVYEALLSYRGSFAEHDLYEVKPADKDHDILGTAWFVSKDELRHYKPEERVLDPTTGRQVVHEKGAFVYRMAGRDRQRSASYYTPQSLTRCVVKYALKELLEDQQGKVKLTAEEILALKVLEPAAGSAAFLNEAIDQLAEAYLQQRQRETGDRIPHDRYAWEKQRVKMLLADNNVFGIDLNPIAIELAEVSLWLNTMHEGAFVPWFGMQLVCGNSLIGARRQVYSGADVDAGKKGEAAPWLDRVPARVPVGQRRPKGAVWHFLLPDRGMAVYGEGSEGKPIRELCAEQLARIETWRAEFTKPLDDDEREQLVALSGAVDRLWAKHVELLRDVRARTTDPLSVWGHEHPEADRRPPTTTAEKDAVWEGEMATDGVRASSPYRRLQLVMDYWCALWFWPIDQAGLLPTREQMLLELGVLLDANVLAQRADGAPGEQRPLFAPTLPDAEAKKLRDLGLVDVPSLIERFPRLKLVQELRKRYRFMHQELEFADVFADRGGFDLVLGNPPWVRIEWNEADVMGDSDPFFVLRKLTGAEASGRREQTLSRTGAREAYLAAHEEAAGMQSFLAAGQNYTSLLGSKVNLYKCFLPQAWAHARQTGVAGFLHPEGVYDEPQGQSLRALAYPRLRAHYQFTNKLQLFAEVHDSTRFSINIYGPERRPIRFLSISNIFHPSTIEHCLADRLGCDPLPGLKNDQDTWETRGHKNRVLQIDERVLKLFAALYDEAGTEPATARLSALHASTLLPTLELFRRATPMAALGEFSCSLHFNESYAVRDGTIRWETSFPEDPFHWVVSGPHFYVACPLYKCPKAVCSSSQAYHPIDLLDVPDDYLPRTNFVRACDDATYLIRTPKAKWGDDDAPVPLTDLYRLVVMNMVNISNERSLQPAIIPPGVSHIHAVNSYAFADEQALAVVAATWASVPLDFFFKSTGSGHFHPNLAGRMAVASRLTDELVVRALVLNCATKYYADLWRRLWRPAFGEDAWAKNDLRLDSSFFSSLSPTWERTSALRTDYARRQALVEIDVLVAMALGIDLPGLIDLYRVQFPVMRQYERETFYDRSGRIVFTTSRGLSGVGLPRTRGKKEKGAAWEDVKDKPSGTVEFEIEDDTLPGGPRTRTIVYEAPFDPCDREADYRTAWAAFEERFGEAAVPKKASRARGRR